jgi:DmsE family decaheme c-type cytochrome
MHSKGHGTKLSKWILLGVLAWAAGLNPLYGSRAKHKQDPPLDPPAPLDLTKYVGSETCKGCHPDVYKQFETTPHWRTLEFKQKDKMGCEACHGPGADHVNAGGGKGTMFNFQGVPAKEISARCLKCHEYGEEHSNFKRSQHSDNQVSCIDCHSPHHAKESQFLLVARQPLLCFSCHAEVRADFSKTFHHRVNEGLVKCTDCHNQHGGFLTKQLRSTAAQDMVCLKCHTDKAGPFVYEHAPVKTEGCVSCHVPHGSANQRLLKRSQVNLLCLECHTLTIDSGAPSIPSFHNQAAKYQACTLCHTQIHGSNFSNVFFK